MRKGWLQRLAALVVVLALGACGRNSSPEASQKASGILPEEQPYNLTVKYDGLIGMAQDTDKILVFLPNANYDPKTVKESQLPPGVFQELGHGGQPTEDDLMQVPPHLARLRFTNAEVSNCASCVQVNGKWELPLQGNDISFNIPQGLDIVTSLDTKVAGPKLIKMSRAELSEEELLTLDHLDPLLLPPNPIDKQRLAARVAIEGGTVKAILDPCSLPQTSPVYTFKLSGDSGGCPGQTVSLAEELVVTKGNV